MKAKKLYDRLKVKPTATKEQIKKAFRKQAFKHHPDRGGSNGKFAKLSEAYAVLVDENRRATYDATGDTRNTHDNSIHERALGNIATMLQQAITQEGERVMYVDLIKSFKDHMSKVIHGCQKEIKKHDKSRKLPEAMLKRLYYKGDEEDFMRGMIKSMIASINQKILTLELEIKVGYRGIEILDQYGFKRMKRTPVNDVGTGGGWVVRGSYGGTTSSTTGF